METANKTLENLAKLKEMFPEVITESKDENGEIVAAVDAKKLEQLLSTKVIEGDECYDFTWVGKKQAMVEACKPIRKTLRPCREESVDWENTQNLYIEGDNLDVLKLLQESYLNKVKMIYIDPPYNTGNDFIYNDNFSMDKDDYEEGTGLKDENELIQFKQNNDSNPRFHSDWCSMMYTRLKLARNLLAEDGVIFISIDNHEVNSLIKICNEVFGERNFIENIIWQKKFSPQNDAIYFSSMHDFILCYAKKRKEAKNDTGWERLLLPRHDMPNGYKNPDNDPRGPWSSGDYTAEGPTPNCIYEIISPNGTVWLPPQGKRWVYNNDNYKQLAKEGRFWFGKDGNSFPRIKRYWNEVQQGLVPNSMWFFEDVGHTQEGKQEANALFGSAVFDYPKPTRLLKRIAQISTQKNDIILDFFSGSATTAHAVMQLNAEDGGKRKFIMVQLPEVCDEKSEAYKAGYKNICEIGKERIRRAGKKIVEETGKKDLDIGFRVLKLDSSNMKDVYYAPADYKQTMLEKMTSNIEDGRTAEDLLYACMLEWGLELSLPHKVEKIAGFDVHIVNNGDLVACFADKISEEAIKQIAEMKPLRAVFRDSSFATDAARVNVGEIFKLKSPNTTIKVL